MPWSEFAPCSVYPPNVSSTIKEKVRKNKVTLSKKNEISTNQLGSRVVVRGTDRRICTVLLPSPSLTKAGSGQIFEDDVNGYFPCGIFSV